MTRPCVSCGHTASIVRFDNNAFTIKHAGLSATIEGLSGSRCAECKDAVFDPDSARRYAEAGDALVLRGRENQARELRRIRRKLGLTQDAAARLTGGGHDAFSRYERSEVAPMPAVVNLFRILDKHPELLSEIS